MESEENDSTHYVRSKNSKAQDFLVETSIILARRKGSELQKIDVLLLIFPEKFDHKIRVGLCTLRVQQMHQSGRHMNK